MTDTAKDQEVWTAAIVQIMAEHPEFSEQDANRGLLWAINDAAAKAGEPTIPTTPEGDPLPAEPDPVPGPDETPAPDRVQEAVALIESGLAALRAALGTP